MRWQKLKADLLFLKIKKKPCQTRTQGKTAVAAWLLPSTNRQSCCSHSGPLGKPSWSRLYLAFSSAKPLIKTRYENSDKQPVTMRGGGRGELTHKIKEDISFHLSCAPFTPYVDQIKRKANPSFREKGNDFRAKPTSFWKIQFHRATTKKAGIEYWKASH